MFILSSADSLRPLFPKDPLARDKPPFQSAPRLTTPLPLRAILYYCSIAFKLLYFRKRNGGNQMGKKTEDVYNLVDEVLRTFSEPYGEDIIEDVFIAIENNHNNHREYDNLVKELGVKSVNPSIGKHTKDVIGYRVLRVAVSKRSNLITSYTKLIP
jgi:hypothetical protein